MFPRSSPLPSKLLLRSSVRSIARSLARQPRRYVHNWRILRCARSRLGHLGGFSHLIPFGVHGHCAILLGIGLRDLDLLAVEVEEAESRLLRLPGWPNVR